MIGNPNQDLLEMPVAMDKSGVIVIGGLNSIAVLHERGIKTESFAMSELVEFDQLRPFSKAIKDLL